ncbi:hypothetical protein [Micromonospora sp. NPDC048830]|uniref:hypothetical protein n=1 Tax=Micromonospora sp. NPDC048830 TaxID=3364257 RepID=UPI00371E9ED4
MIWLAIGLFSRFSMSALGLQFAPPGSAALDTVGVIFMLVPAAVLSNCLPSQAPSLEAVRARNVLVPQLLWSAWILLVSCSAPLFALSVLHPSVDSRSFYATWLLVVGAVLALALVLSTVMASLTAFFVLAVFTTPNVISWQHNLVYNVGIGGTSALVGAALAVTALLLHGVKNSSIGLSSTG